MKVLGIALCSTLLLLDLGFLVYLFLERPGYLGLTSRYCVFGLQHIYALGLPKENSTMEFVRKTKFNGLLLFLT